MPFLMSDSRCAGRDTRTIGASGPRLKPEMDVKQHSAMTGRRFPLADGMRLTSAGPPSSLDNTRTISWAENSFGKNSVDRTATVVPPSATTIGMYAAGCPFRSAPNPVPEEQPPPPAAPGCSSSDDGTVFHNSSKPAFMHLE